MHPMQPCRFPPGEVPNCTNLREAAGQTLYKGLVVRRTAGGLLEKHPLNTASGVLGVTQGGPALNGEVNVAKADMVTEFLAHISTLVEDEPEIVEVDHATHVGQTYGIAEIEMDAGTAAQASFLTLRSGGTGLVQITDVKPELNVAIFKFLPAVMQETPS